MPWFMDLSAGLEKGQSPLTQFDLTVKGFWRLMTQSLKSRETSLHLKHVTNRSNVELCHVDLDNVFIYDSTSKEKKKFVFTLKG